MEQKEINQQWKDFIDDVAGIFHWSNDNGDAEGIFRSGLEGDMPLEGLDRFYISKELGKILDKYKILIPQPLHYSILATMTEKPKLTEVAEQ